MAQDLAELNIRVKSKEVETAERRLDDFNDQADRSQGSVKNLLGLLAKLAAAFGLIKGIGESLRLAAQFEQTQIGMRTLIGDTEKTNKLLKELEDFAATTPFQFQGLADTAKQMLALGVEVEDVGDRLRIVADATAALGGGNELMTTLVQSLGKIEAKGAVSAEEMNRFAEAGINAWQILADAMGVTVPEAMKLAEQKAIDVDAAINALLEGMRAQFQGSTEALAQTTGGLFSTLKDVVSFAMRDVGQVLIDNLNIKQLLRDAAVAATQLGKVLSDVIRILTGTNAEFEETSDIALVVARSIRAVTAAVGVLLGMQLVQWLSGATKALKALNIALMANPWLAVAAAIGLVIAAIAYFWDETVRIGDSTVTVGDIVVGTWNWIKDVAVLAFDTIVYVWKHLEPEIKKVFNAIGDYFGPWIDSFRDAWPETLDTILDWLKDFANSFLAVFDTILDAIASAIGRLITTVQSIGDIDFTSLESIQNFVRNASETLSPGAFLDDVTDAWSKNFGHDYVSSISDSLSGVAASMKQEATMIFKALMTDPEFAGLFARFEDLGLTDPTSAFQAIMRSVREASAARQAPEVGAIVGPDVTARAATGASGADPDAFGLGDKVPKEVEKARQALKAYFEDLEFELAIADELNGVRGRAAELRKVEAQALVAYGGDALKVAEAVAEAEEKLNKLAEKERFRDFYEDLAGGVEDAFANGLIAAMKSEDVADIMYRSLEMLAEEAFRFAISEAFKTQEGGSNLFFDLLKVAGSAIGISAGGDTPAGEGGEGGAGAPTGGGGEAKEIVLLNVPDRATADALAQKMSTSATEAVVMRGTGQPGVSAGSIPARRRR